MRAVRGSWGANWVQLAGARGSKVRGNDKSVIDGEKIIKALC
jgi:hypothetical protein